MEKKNKVQWVYSSKNEEELTERYDEWAKTYDADLERDFEIRFRYFDLHWFQSLS